MMSNPFDIYIEAPIDWAKQRIDSPHYLEVQSLVPAAGWTPPQYLGWAPIERIFAGYRKSIDSSATT